MLNSFKKTTSIPVNATGEINRRELQSYKITTSSNFITPITFAKALPVCARREEIARTIAAHQVVIVCGETGSGKTTQLPKICLTLGRGLVSGGTGLIGHTQPRRLAASAIARRIAEELGTSFSKVVGFKVRFTDNITPDTSIKLMTDGILLAETQTDPLLKAYDTLIIDEAHERSLNIDLLLGYVKEILPRRPDLKLIVTSATIDAKSFAHYFGTVTHPAPVIEVGGRLYPVEVRYRPIAKIHCAIKTTENTSERAKFQYNINHVYGGRRNSVHKGYELERNLMNSIVDAVDELCSEGPGDILIFLPGEREIREVDTVLRKHRHLLHTEILLLFARLSTTEQERIFRPPSNTMRRIVLATNVAETSLTVSGIRYVIDTGLARVKRYSYRKKIEQLKIEPISQAAANQRAGRCGRVTDGICIRLFDESNFQGRARFTDPEILRSSLASVILRMMSLHLPTIETFPFIDPPPTRAIADGYQLLHELGAVDDNNALSPLGCELARLPLDPRIGRMILAAREQQALTEVLVIASALSVQDPRERLLETQKQADEAHRQFADEYSEFLQWLKIWAWFKKAVAHKKSNDHLMHACRKNFFSYMRLREWRDVHSQLLTVVRKHGWYLNKTAATFEQIHLALLTGLLGNIGLKTNNDELYYLGARGIKFYLWRQNSTSVKKIRHRWIVAAELIETNRLYARTIAKIEPEWLERIGAHLLKKSLSDPHWEKHTAQVIASERAVLYSLPVYQRRRVNFGMQNPTSAREQFIRSALVEREFDTKLAFFAHNRKLLTHIKQLEHKSRRQDILVDEESIYAFYDKVVPINIYTGAAFEHWYCDEVKKSGQTENELRLLYLSRNDLMRCETTSVTTELFPKHITIAGIQMKLDYHFEPGSLCDGLTLTVPLYTLNQIDAYRCEWLVSGMIKEKTQFLLKSLSQKLRCYCVPLTDYAVGFTKRHTGKHFGTRGLIEALIDDVHAEKNIALKTSDFKLEKLPTHLFMNFRVIDKHGKQLAMGRNLAQLRTALSIQAQQQFQKHIATCVQSPATTVQILTRESHTIIAHRSLITGLYKNITTWNFGNLPKFFEIRYGEQTLVSYPALVDCGTHCDIKIFDSLDEASHLHRTGLKRLFILQLRESIRYLEKNLPDLHEIKQQFMPQDTQKTLRDQLIDAALNYTCLQEPLPKDDASFYIRCKDSKTHFTLLTQEIARLVGDILTERVIIMKKLAQVKVFVHAYTDIQAQLDALTTKRFIVETPYTQLTHFPRYLKGITLRIDKLITNPTRDTRLSAEFQPIFQHYQRALVQCANLPDFRLAEFRWLLEELRISLFAQELRTSIPISVKRLYKVWESMQR